MSYTSRNPQFASTVLDDIASTTPSNPISGKHKLVDRDGKLYLRNSAGVERSLGGGTNYIVYDKSSTGWATSDVSKLTVTTDTTAAELPRNSTSKTGIKIQSVASADSTNAYVYYDFTLDDVDLNGRVMSIKWDQKPLAVPPTAGDLVVDLVAQSDRTTTLVTPFTTAISVLEGTAQTYFLSPSVAAVSLRIKSLTNMADNAGLVISDVVVGPNVQVQGAAIGAWKTYAVTLTNGGTTSTNTGKYREVGDTIEIETYAVFTGAGAAANLGVSIPSQFTFASMPGGSAPLGIVGISEWLDASAGTYTMLSPSRNGTQNINFLGNGATASFLGNALANGDAFAVKASIPVNELSSNVTLLSNTNIPTEAAGAIQAFAGATAPKGWAICNGSELAIASYPDLYSNIGTTWNTTTNPLTGSVQAAPSAGNFRIPNLQGVFLRGVGTYAGSDAYNAANSVSLGAYQVDQGQGHYHRITDKWLSSRVTSAGGGQSSYYETTASGILDTLNAITDGTHGAPRLSGFETAPKQVGINYIIRLFNSGLGAGACPISSANIVGRTDGVAPAAGMVGEKILANTITNVTLTNSAQVYNAASITIPAGGAFMLYGKVYYGAAGTSMSEIVTSISDTSATENLKNIDVIATGVKAAVTGSPIPLYVTAAGTYYLTARMGFSGTAPVTNSSYTDFYAVRQA